jgi:RNA polymerase subunit RPABC4/transcription elongation factor Spt4
MLTKAQKSKYIKDPNHCPYCKGADITSEEFDYNEPLGRVVSCENCGETWVETLTVTDVE